MPIDPTIASVLMDHLEGQLATATKVTKPWGEEVIVATDDCVIKVIEVDEDHRTSLQYHVEKDELIIPFDGTGYIAAYLAWNEDGDKGEARVSGGGAIRLRPGVRHRAVGPLRFLEISTPHLDDVVRVQDDYRP